MLIKAPSDTRDTKDHIVIASIACSIFFFIIALRLIELQLVNGKTYIQFSEKNRITIQKIHAVRGKILDRNGSTLVDNRPSFDITMTRGQIGDYEKDVFMFFSKELGLSDEEIENLRTKLMSAPKFDSITALEDIEWDKLAKVKANNYRLPGVSVRYRPMRRYPFENLACHVLGYLREVTKEQLEKSLEEDVTPLTRGDYIGVWGIEKQFDVVVRGLNGNRPLIEDAFGREIREETSEFLLPAFRKREAVPGKNLYLTIDLTLQQQLENSFEGRQGAGIVMDVKTGEILAMVSSPCFDLNKFSRTIPADYWRTLREDPNKPLYDRTTMGIYPPGSTYKIVVAAAGLRYADEIDFSSFQPCYGSYRLGRERKRCWKAGGHGRLNLEDAIAQSCNVFFYQLGLALGADRIAQEAKRFGLGQPTGVVVNNELSGIIPSTRWKEKRFAEPWVDGETASVSIGQGFVATTPIQMVRVAAAIANGGQVLQPKLVRHVEDVQQTSSKINFSRITPTVVSDLELDEDKIARIREGMARVVKSQNGTAYWSGRSSKTTIAGKTGTAQVVKQRAGEKMSEEFEDHAWFIAFAPEQEDPQIAVAIIVEHKGHGGSSAAPIARKVIETYIEMQEG